MLSKAAWRGVAKAGFQNYSRSSPDLQRTTSSCGLRMTRNEFRGRQPCQKLSRRLLATVTDDEKAPIYLRVQAARSLLAQRDPEDDDEDEQPTGGHTIVLPSNGRDLLVEDDE